MSVWDTGVTPPGSLENWWLCLLANPVPRGIPHSFQEPAPYPAHTVGKEQEGFVSPRVHPGVAEPFSEPPNMRGVPIALLTLPCVSHCTPGQHLKPRAGSQYSAGSRGLYAMPEWNAPGPLGQPCFYFMYTVSTNRILCSLTRTWSSSHGAPWTPAALRPNCRDAAPPQS